jgi:Ca2+-binding EF-hand superfamily protein
LFDLYDEDGSNELSYKEFVGCLYGNTSITKGTDKKRDDDRNTKKSQLAKDDTVKIIEKVRSKLASRGVRGIISIGKNFRIIDDDNSRNLCFSEFKKACKDFRFELNDNEIDTAFKAFDRNGEGEISYDEFLRTLRGEMNPSRTKLVDQAFSKIDKDGNGWLDIEDIKGVYNARNHPDVKQGKKTEEEVLLEFLETFETHHNIIVIKFNIRIAMLLIMLLLEKNSKNIMRISACLSTMMLILNL